MFTLKHFDVGVEIDCEGLFPIDFIIVQIWTSRFGFGFKLFCHLTIAADLFNIMLDGMIQIYMWRATLGKLT